MTQSTTSTLPDFLTPDCTACSGLCCVVLPFDAAQGFGFDKAAHTPCQHLQADFRCEIHSQLRDRGFSGCVQYNCYGAGQATMKLIWKLVGNAPWTQSQEHAERMFEVFTTLRPIHELMAKLSLAAANIDEPQLKDTLSMLLAQLEHASRSQALINDTLRIAELKAMAQSALRAFSQSAAGVTLRQSLT